MADWRETEGFGSGKIWLFSQLQLLGFCFKSPRTHAVHCTCASTKSNQQGVKRRLARTQRRVATHRGACEQDRQWNLHTHRPGDRDQYNTRPPRACHALGALAALCTGALVTTNSTDAALLAMPGEVQQRCTTFVASHGTLCNQTGGTGREPVPPPFYVPTPSSSSCVFMTGMCTPRSRSPPGTTTPRCSKRGRLLPQSSPRRC